MRPEIQSSNINRPNSHWCSALVMAMTKSEFPTIYNIFPANVSVNRENISIAEQRIRTIIHNKLFSRFYHFIERKKKHESERGTQVRFTEFSSGLQELIRRHTAVGIKTLFTEYRKDHARNWVCVFLILFLVNKIWFPFSFFGGTQVNLIQFSEIYFDPMDGIKNILKRSRKKIRKIWTGFNTWKSDILQHVTSFSF